MARPIEPTPPLEGADAQALLATLDQGASRAEMNRRTEEARRYMAEVAAGTKTIVLKRRQP
jgi:hypothetical protein